MCRRFEEGLTHWRSPRYGQLGFYHVPKYSAILSMPLGWLSLPSVFLMIVWSCYFGRHMQQGITFWEHREFVLKLIKIVTQSNKYCNTRPLNVFISFCTPPKRSLQIFQSDLVQTSTETTGTGPLSFFRGNTYRHQTLLRKCSQKCLYWYGSRFTIVIFHTEFSGMYFYYLSAIDARERIRPLYTCEIDYFPSEKEKDLTQSYTKNPYNNWSHEK